MRRHIRLYALGVLLSSFPGLTATAGDEGMGFTTYYFSDSGDNSVITTSFNLAKKLLERTMFLIDIELDQVTAPAVTAVTGATRPQRRKDEPFEKNRGQIIVGFQQGLSDNATVAAHYYRSQEVDYGSNAIIGTFSQEFNDKNTTVTVRGQYNADVVGEIREAGDIINRNKKTYNGSVNVTQVLTPNTVLDASYDLVIHKGFQSDPYRQVRVLDANGSSVTVHELHPLSRTRHAAATRLSQFIVPIRASLLASYRYYFDSWKVKSHTAEIKLNKYILSTLVLGVDYRYYNQSAAYFYQPRYAGAQYQSDGLRTADYKLKAFSSNNFGFTLTYLLSGLSQSNADLEFLRDSAIEVQYVRYFNDLDFSANILQASIKFSI